MESVVRAVIIYFFLMIVFRFAGRRTLGQITMFDFVLLLIISEAIQQGMIGDDNSMTNAVLIVLTLILLNIGLSLLKLKFQKLDRLLEGTPLIIVENGRPLRELMSKERVDEEDILTAARETHGLERMDQIKYAVLERSGGISIIPKG